MKNTIVHIAPKSLFYQWDYRGMNELFLRSRTLCSCFNWFLYTI